MGDPVENPYVGPRTFEEKDSRFFFGREREARDLLWLVMSEPLALFYAPSGAGKSSLINTRLVPGLREAGFEVLPTGRVSGELPAGVGQVDNIFVFNLLLSLDRGREKAERLAHTSLGDYLSSGTYSPSYGMQHSQDAQDATQNLKLPTQNSGEAPDTTGDDVHEERGSVLIVDQFEEIVTAHLGRWEERKDFFRQLAQALRRDPLLGVVLAMREDFVAALDPYARLLPGKLRARFYMQRMGHQAALEAVKRPAELHGRPFAAGVAETLVDNLRQVRVQGETEPQLGEFVEPVQLQVVCYQLWENLKDRPPAEITQQDLQELGDVDTALAQFYEQAIARVLRETDESEIQLRNWFGRQLITEAGTRGMVYRGEARTAGLANRVVDHLANQFLLRAEVRAGGTWYELVHDRFIEPIRKANVNWLLRQSDLVQTALAWEAADPDQKEDSLYRGQRLKAALESVSGQTVEPLVAEFLAASEKLDEELREREASRQRELEQAQALAEAESLRAQEQAKSSRRLRLLAFGLALILLAALVAAWLAVQARGEAQRQAAAARAAEQTAVEAQASAERSTLIARTGQLAAQSQAAIVESYPQRGLLLAVEAVHVVSQTAEVRVPAAEDALWQALTSTAGRGLGVYQDAVTALAISPDSRWLVAGGRATAQLWNLGDPVAKPIGLSVEEAPVVAADFSPDGRWLAMAGGTLVQVWNLSDSAARPVILADHGDTVTALAIGPDSRLVTAALDNTIRVWDLADLENEPLVLSGLEYPAEALAVSPDNRWLIAASSSDTIVHVWDLADLGAEPFGLPSPGPITTIAVSPDSRWLVGGGNDTFVWDLTDPDPAATTVVLPSESFVEAVAISPDSGWLVTGNQDASVQVWDLTDLGGLPDILSGHTGAITRVLVGPGAGTTWIITASLDREVQLWDLSDLAAEPMILSGHDDGVTRIALSPDERWLATGGADGTARLWDLALPNPAAAAPLVLTNPTDASITHLAVSPDNRWLVAADVDASLSVWDLASADPLLTQSPAAASSVPPGQQGLINALAISPDSRWLVTGGDDAALRVWDLPRGLGLDSSPITLVGHQWPINALSLSADSRWLASGDDGGEARMWDLAAPDPAVRSVALPGQAGAIYALALSSANPPEKLVTAGGDGDVRVWDISALAAGGSTAASPAADPLVLTGHQASIRALVIGPEDRWLASGDEDGMVLLWDMGSLPDSAGGPIRLTGHTQPITAMRASRDGRWLVTASADQTARMWDIPALLSGSPRAADAAAAFVLRGHERSILAVALSADSRWLATGDFEGLARLWDLSAADPSASPIVLRSHRRGIFSMAISPDNHWLVTGSQDATVSFWTLRIDELVALACRTAGRNLTADEWARYFPGQAYRTTCAGLPVSE